MTEYFLGTEERRRLELLELCLDPNTARSLDAIGVEPGWRCLEVGGGGGSVTRMLCERVGPAGRVTAVDLDTRFLDELTETNLDVHRQDVLTDGVPGDGYDLVHARLLLMHLPGRETFLEELAARVRPGGWLLIEDTDVFSVTELTDGLYGRLWEAIIASFGAANAAAELGRALPRLFCCAGLEDVEVVCDVPIFAGGSPWAELMQATVGQMQSLLLANGMTKADLDDVHQLLANRCEWFSAFAIHAVRGRAPIA